MQNESKARRLANAALASMPIYHASLPTLSIDEILNAFGFRTLEPAIYCGRDGRSSEQVGEKTWFCMTWHKMEETGNYEIVAYLS